MGCAKAGRATKSSAELGARFLETNQAAFLMDIHTMPAVARFFALPKMRRYPHRIVLVEAADTLAAFPAQPGRVTVLAFTPAGRIRKISFWDPVHEPAAGVFEGKWGGRRDSNPQQQAPQAWTLPLSYDHRPALNIEFHPPRVKFSNLDFALAWPLVFGSSPLTPHFCRWRIDNPAFLRHSAAMAKPALGRATAPWPQAVFVAKPLSFPAGFAPAPPFEHSTAKANVGASETPAATTKPRIKPPASALVVSHRRCIRLSPNDPKIEFSGNVCAAMTSSPSERIAPWQSKLFSSHKLPLCVRRSSAGRIYARVRPSFARCVAEMSQSWTRSAPPICFGRQSIRRGQPLWTLRTSRRGY